MEQDKVVWLRAHSHLPYGYVAKINGYHFARRTESGLLSTFSALVLKKVRLFNNYFWLIPFASFLFGYIIVQYTLEITSYSVPSIVGMQVHEALKLVGKQPLSLRLLSQKEDNDLPTGTIVSQTPLAGQKIKAHQALFIVVSKQIRTQIAPTLIGKTDHEIENICHKHEVSCTHYTIPSVSLDQNCFAQLPRPGNAMHDNVIIAYKGSTNKKAAIFPRLKGLSLDTVKLFLEEHNCRIILKAPSEVPDNKLIITDHRPMAGSIINNIADSTIQLSCKKDY